MDRAVGKLRNSLRELDIHRDTIFWYCSDNGEPANAWYKPRFNGSKGNMFEGGIRVPAFIEWPNGIPNPGSSRVNCVTSDMMPTLLDWLDIPLPKNRVIDGISLDAVVQGTMKQRPNPFGVWRYHSRDESKHGEWMAFASPTGETPTNSNPATQFNNYKHPVAKTENFGGDVVWIDNRFKLMIDTTGRHRDTQQVITPITDDVSLFDLEKDPQETVNVAGKFPEIVSKMTAQLHQWQASVEKSLTGAEFIP